MKRSVAPVPRCQILRGFLRGFPPWRRFEKTNGLMCWKMATGFTMVCTSKMIWLVVWECHNPNWMNSIIFQRGWLKPPTSQGFGANVPSILEHPGNPLEIIEVRFDRFLRSRLVRFGTAHISSSTGRPQSTVKPKYCCLSQNF